MIFSFIKDDTTKEILVDSYNAITKLNLWEWMRTEEPPAECGYMFWDHSNMQKLYSQPGVNQFSGAVMGYGMRNMQYIAQNGWSDFVKQWNKQE